MVIALTIVMCIAGIIFMRWVGHLILRAKATIKKLSNPDKELEKRLNNVEWAMRLGMKSLLNGVYIRQGICKIERKSLDDNNQYVYETRIIRQPFLIDGRLRGETKQCTQLVIELDDNITKFEEATDDEKKEFIKEYNSHFKTFEVKAW
ncbi:hypothetical protein [Pediococcus pentosaceus]|uniref:hypothetical protein n=1 Tax=Pediococcus pentosaceus TaxID=1255 RepID=UPI001F5A8E69|nr:hypothetical protein [Pediococcus pentosaceus]MCI2961033.1 hypothetical protein [Pediococcus pentosaceus]